MIRVLPWLAVAPLFLVPVGAAVAAALRAAPDSGLRGAGDVAALLASPSVGGALRFSVLQAVASTALALALGLPGAWLLACHRFRGRGLFRAMSGLPFVFPPVLFTLGFTAAWGRNGWVNQALMALIGTSVPPLDIAYSFWGVVAAHALFNFPLVIALVAPVWAKSPARLEDAARCLGAGEARVFFTVTLPGLGPGVLAAASLVFLYCFMSFAIPLALGGGPEFATLEVAVYVAASGEQDFAKAAFIAAVEAVVAVGALAAWLAASRRALGRGGEAGASEPREALPLAALGRGRAWLSRAYLGAAALVAVSPLLALAASSLREPARPGRIAAWGFGQYRALAADGDFWRAAGNSLLLAAGVAALALGIGLLLAAGERWGGGGVGAAAGWRWPARPGTGFRAVFFALPAALSSVMLSLGYLALFPLGAGAGVLALVQATAAYPLAWRTLALARSRVGRDLGEAASLLGAGRWRQFRDIELPLMRPALAGALALGAAVSLGDVNAALMLNVADFPLLGLEAYRLMGAYQFGRAAAVGVVLCLVAGAAWLAADRLSAGGGEGRDGSVA